MSEEKTYSKKIYAIFSMVLLVAVIASIVFTYPWLQLQIGTMLVSSGNYQQAERVLTGLVESRPDWTEPRRQLVLTQLRLGKPTEAARTVTSLAEHGLLDGLDLAVIFIDVSRSLINTGYSQEALDLSRVVLEEHNDPHMQQAVIEVCINIAEVSALPLALESINLALSLSPNDWLLQRNALNLLLSKALTAPAYHARPALERVLELSPENTLALSQMAKIIGNTQGAKPALDYLADKELTHSGITESTEYVSTKRRLIMQLAMEEPGTDLTGYTYGIPDATLKDMALQGLGHARRQQQAGTNFYQLYPDSAEVMYRFGRNLYLVGQWQEAREIFMELRASDPDYTNFNAVFATINFHLNTEIISLGNSQRVADQGKLNDPGTYAAITRWVEAPWNDDVSTELFVRNLETDMEIVLGQAYDFHWSASGNHLAYMEISEGGTGRLFIFVLGNYELIQVAESYDVMDYNWAGDTLMVQAVSKQGTLSLLQVQEPDWEDSEPLVWPEITADINTQLRWLTMGRESVTLWQHNQPVQTIGLGQEVVSVSRWSPNGRYAIIETVGKNYYIFDSNTVDAAEIPTAGSFAGWSGNSQLYWYHPVWEGLLVLIRINHSGAVQQYLPYAFNAPAYQLSIASQGQRVIAVMEEDVYLFSR